MLVVLAGGLLFGLMPKLGSVAKSWFSWNDEDVKTKKEEEKEEESKDE